MPAALVDIPVDGPAAEVYRTSPEEGWRVIRTKWRVTGVTPGLHAVRLRTTGQSPRTIERVVKVPAGDIGKLEIAVP